MNLLPVDGKTLASMDNLLKVMFPKPTPFPLVRVGGRSDGAYLIPNDLDGIRACFSPGCCNTKNFEDELATGLGIRSHMCDYSSDADSFSTPMMEGLQSFRKKWLDVNDDPDSISLERWINESEPGDSDLILQMDIEGAEYRNLISTPQACLSRFRIVVIELHDLDMMNDRSKDDVRPLLRKLNEDFVCVHAHPNNCCGQFAESESGLKIPRVLELTFLRRDRFESGDGNDQPAPSVPSPLDISANMPHKRPLFLSSQWTGTQRSNESLDRLFEMQADYTEESAANIRAEMAELEERIRLLERRLDELHWPVLIFRTLKRFLRFLVSPFTR